MDEKLPKKLDRTVVYESDWIRLCTDKVEMPSGRIIEKYHILDYPFESIVVLLTNEKNEVCFIRSKRYSNQRIELEIPAGGIDKGEDLLTAAIREVREETGFEMINPEKIYLYHPSNGMSTERIHVIKGTTSGLAKHGFDTDEVAGIVWLSRDQVQEMVSNRELEDGKSLIPILLYLNS